MINFKKKSISVACSLLLLSPVAIAAPAVQSMQSMTSGVYLGAFGGWGKSNEFGITQSGVAMYNQHTASSGLDFPLAVVATGDADRMSVGFYGLHLGYEMVMPTYKDSPIQKIIPAIEIEGLYFKKTADADLFNANNPNRLPDHEFEDSFPMKTGVILVNGVFSLNCLKMSMLQPYVGFGIGAARISISGADAEQVTPPEAGVNHFNSDSDAADWTFAGQVKAGVKVDFNEHWRVFAEYRYLYLGNTDYTFGSTQNVPGHVETTSWVVDMDNIYFNSGVLGIEFKA